MQAASLSSVIPLVAKQMGLSPREDRDTIIATVNLIRDHAFADNGLRQAYFRKAGCSRVQTFASHCYTGKCSSYVGITLDPGVTGVTHLDYAGVRIAPSKERMRPGCSSCGCMEFEPTIERSVFQTELPRGFKGKIVFRAKHANDAGKLVGIEYVTWDGSVIREDVKISTSGGETSRSPMHVTMITLPDRCDYIDAMTSTGIMLGFYHPGITSPSMLRLKVGGVRVGMNLQWEGKTEPLPVRFDSDQVEWSDALQWRNFTMLSELHFKTTKTGPESQAYIAAGIVSTSLGESALAARQTVPITSMRPKSSMAVRAINRLVRGLRR